MPSSFGLPNERCSGKSGLALQIVVQQLMGSSCFSRGEWDIKLAFIAVAPEVSSKPIADIFFYML